MNLLMLGLRLLAVACIDPYCIFCHVMQEKSKKVIVKKSIKGMGKGLCADEDIFAGDFVIEYVGKILDSKEADKLKTRYLFEIDERYTIDGSPAFNTARYINHFCDANLEARIETGSINLYALRDIKKGEELGFDYGEEYFDDFIRKVGCKCQAKIHR